MEQLTNTNSNTVLLTEGAVYNGDIWTKIDLMQYIDKAIKLKVQFDAGMEIMHEHCNRQQFLYSQRKRRTFAVTVMEKPTGLAALSKGKRKKYEKWLAQAPEREEERRIFEEKEDERLQKLDEEDKALDNLIAKDRDYMFKVSEEFKNHLLQHIIPPDYREDGILRLLLHYLIDNRAHTLTDAINLYHQEKHWKNLENIAKQQENELRQARNEQKALMREQLRQQAEHNEKIQNAVNDIKRTAESAEFWLMMDYLKD